MDLVKQQSGSLVEAITNTFETMLSCELEGPIVDNRNLPGSNIFLTENQLSGEVDFSIQLQMHLDAVKAIASRVFSLDDESEKDFEILNDVFLEIDNIICGTVRSHLVDNSVDFSMDRTYFRIIFMEEKNKQKSEEQTDITREYLFVISDSPIKIVIKYPNSSSFEVCSSLLE